MLSNVKIKNIFSDRATIIPRMMMQDPTRKWVVRDFVGADGVSLGMAQSVLEAMARKGYAERVKKGPGSHTVLSNKDLLIADWLKGYEFSSNTVDSYYSPDRNILKRVKDMLGKEQYALTLHAAANLMTSFVKTEETHLYLRLQDWGREIPGILQKLDLKELVRGGNVHLIRPHYKTSVFFNEQTIKGYPVVSHLQLYLDLYHFQPRGREHAEYLAKYLKDKGKALD